MLNRSELFASQMKTKLNFTDKSLKLHTNRLTSLELIKYERTGERNIYKKYSLTEKGKVIAGILK